MNPLVYVLVGVICVCLIAVCIVCECKRRREIRNTERSSSYNFEMWRPSERGNNNSMSATDNHDSSDEETENVRRDAPRSRRDNIPLARILSDVRRRHEIVPEKPAPQHFIFNVHQNPGFSQRSPSKLKDEYKVTPYGGFPFSHTHTNAHRRLDTIPEEPEMEPLVPNVRQQSPSYFEEDEYEETAYGGLPFSRTCETDRSMEGILEGTEMEPHVFNVFQTPNSEKPSPAKKFKKDECEEGAYGGLQFSRAFPNNTHSSFDTVLEEHETEPPVFNVPHSPGCFQLSPPESKEDECERDAYGEFQFSRALNNIHSWLDTVHQEHETRPPVFNVPEASGCDQLSPPEPVEDECTKGARGGFPLSRSLSKACSRLDTILEEPETEPPVFNVPQTTGCYQLSPPESEEEECAQGAYGGLSFSRGFPQTHRCLSTILEEPETEPNVPETPGCYQLQPPESEKNGCAGGAYGSLPFFRSFPKTPRCLSTILEEPETEPPVFNLPQAPSCDQLSPIESEEDEYEETVNGGILFSRTFINSNRRLDIIPEATESQPLVFRGRQSSGFNQQSPPEPEEGDIGDIVSGEIPFCSICSGNYRRLYRIPEEPNENSLVFNTFQNTGSDQKLPPESEEDEYKETIYGNLQVSRIFTNSRMRNLTISDEPVTDSLPFERWQNPDCDQQSPPEFVEDEYEETTSDEV